MEHVTNKVAIAAKWSTITEILARIVSPITNAILARLLVPEAFGAVATINMVISFAEIFTDAGFQKYIVQHEFRDEQELNESTNVAFWTNMVVSVFLWGIIFVFKDKLAAIVGDETLGNGIAVASIAMLLVSVSGIHIARFRRELNFKALFVSRMAVAFTPLLITVPLAIILRSYWALIFGTLAAQVVQAVILSVKSKWHPRIAYSWTRLKEMLSFSMWTLSETISIWLTNYIDTLIVGNLLNSYFLGLYKTSMSTVNAYTAIVTSAVTPVLFSGLSRLQHDDKAFRTLYFKVQRVTSLAIMPMCVGMFLYRDLVTQILLGSQWAEAAEFIGVWSLTSGIMISLSYFNSEVFRSKGKPKISLLVQIVHLAVLVPSIIIAARGGFRTLYITRSLVRFVSVDFIFMWVLVKISPMQILRNNTPQILSTGIMAITALILQHIRDGMLWDFFSIGLCAVVYALVVFAIPQTRKELTEIPIIKKFTQNWKKILKRI